MDTPRPIQASTLPLVLLACAAPLWGQGSLTPPGPPGPMMKTLEQIEPRTIITQLPFSITRPGSYYLTNELATAGAVNGIVVESDNVTIDLNGFALRGWGGEGNGIVAAAAVKGLAVRNGAISRWKTGMLATNASSCQIEGLRIHSNSGSGAAIGANSTVTRCTFEENGGNGLLADFGTVVAHCTAQLNDEHGFLLQGNNVVTTCVSDSNGWTGFYSFAGVNFSSCASAANGYGGFDIGHGCTMTACTASYNSYAGIVAAKHCTIKSCTSYYNDGNGMQFQDGCLILDNVATENGFDAAPAAGIHVTGTDNRVDGNHVVGNVKTGILIANLGNLIIRNTASGNTTNFTIVPKNTLGPIGSPPTVTSPWANIAF